MPICHDCHSIVDYPVTIKRSYGNFAGCPHCHSDDIRESRVCAACGDEVELIDLSDDLCPSCQVKTIRRFMMLLLEFTPEELSYLNTRYDGVYFGDEEAIENEFCELQEAM